MTVARKLRMGMVGGGPGAFIGPVHRIAAELDGKIELVAGAFSQSAERSRAAGESYKIEPGRAYANYQEMLDAERRRPDPIDFVAIVTPNHLHLPFVSMASDIVKGDLLVTSGLGGVFPAGYPVGTVTDVRRDPAASLADVDVQPAAALDRSRQLLLIWVDEPK